MSTVSHEFDGTAVADPAAQLQQRLSDPKTAEALNRVLDRLDIFSFLLECIDGFLRRGDVVVDSLSEGVAELRRFDGDLGGVEALASKLPQLAKSGSELADLSEKTDLHALVESGLAEKLTDPKTLAQLSALLDRLEVATFGLEALDGFLRRGEVVADSIASGLAEWKQFTPTRGEKKLAKLFTEDLPKMTNAAGEMMASGMLDPRILGTLGELGSVVAQANLEAKRDPPAPVGLFGLIRAMRDPEVQLAVGSALHVLKRYGEHVAEEKHQ